MRTVAASLICLLAAAMHGETLDRIAATVGKHVVTESRVIQDLRAYAMVQHMAVDLSGPAKRAATGWRIDQQLILQEAEDSHLSLPGPDAYPFILQTAKADYPSDEKEYRADLVRNQLTERDLADFLLSVRREKEFVNARFRPEIQISDDDLRAAYETKYGAEVKANPATAPSFEAKRDELEKTLTDERATQALDAWLAMARMGAQIEYREKVFP